MLTGKEAEDVCRSIISGGNAVGYKGRTEYPEPFVCGYFPEDCGFRPGYTTFDNTTGDCWVEWFKTEAEAIAWCEGKIEAPGL